MLTGLRITLHGHLESITLSEPLVPALRKAIDCRLVGVISLADGITLYVDPHGSRRMPPNIALTLIAAKLGARRPIFGAGVLLGNDDGEPHSLTRAQARRIVNAYLTVLVDMVRADLHDE